MWHDSDGRLQSWKCEQVLSVYYKPILSFFPQFTETRFVEWGQTLFWPIQMSSVHLPGKMFLPDERRTAVPSQACVFLPTTPSSCLWGSVVEIHDVCSHGHFETIGRGLKRSEPRVLKPSHGRWLVFLLSEEKEALFVHTSLNQVLYHLYPKAS